MTNYLSQAWHWKWENTISPDSDSRLGSGVDSGGCDGRMPSSFDLILVILAIKMTHIVCKQ